MKNRILKSVGHLFDNIPLKIKIMITFFVLIFIPMLSFTIITYSRISRVVMEQYLSTATMSFNEASNAVNRSFLGVEKAMDMVSTYPLIFQVEARDTLSYSYEMELEDTRQITNYIDSAKLSSGVSKIKLYTKDYYNFTNENIENLSLVKTMKDPWFNTLDSSKENSLWLNPSDKENETEENRSFSLLRKIYSTNNYKRQTGVIKVDFFESKIDELMKNSLISPNSFALIISNKKGICSISGNADPKIIYELSNIPENDAQKWNKKLLGGMVYYIKGSDFENIDFRFMTAIPEKDLTAMGIGLRNEMLLIMFIVTIISYTLAYFISWSSIRRISVLANEISKVKNGNMNIHIKKTGRDEIGQLMSSFNSMVETLRELLDEQYKLGREIKNAELKALQAQINPHFLYNSLDLINCHALKNNIPEINTMVVSLSRFYKLTLSKGMDIIPIRDEITHVSLYVKIQNMRFNGCINFIVDIPEQVYEYCILKVLLQPIVENSIMHGILEKEDKCGTITISAVQRDESITFTIKDDGVGIPQEKLANVVDGSKSSESHGYGIKNVNDRIKLYYGIQYGVYYKSLVGEGTCVTLVIPKEKYS